VDRAKLELISLPDDEERREGYCLSISLKSLGQLSKEYLSKQFP